jgi:hypothetical protein
LDSLTPRPVTEMTPDELHRHLGEIRRKRQEQRQKPPPELTSAPMPKTRKTPSRKRKAPPAPGTNLL